MCLSDFSNFFLATCKSCCVVFFFLFVVMNVITTKWLTIESYKHILKCYTGFKVTVTSDH